MPLSPICLVNSGPTANGVDVAPSSVVNITLLDPTTPGMQWFLEVVGTDELTTVPILSNVNVLTHQVVSPSSTVSFTFPSGAGKAIGFKSRVTGTGGPIETTFGVYSLTAFSTRVGFVTETREGDVNFGWATKLNPLIRSGGGGGGGGGGGFTLTLVDDTQTIPEKQSMLFEDHVVIEDGGNLIVEGDTTCIRTEDNFSVLYVPTRQERVVQQNDELLFTDDMTVDGQLTVDGQISDATPYDGYDVLAALTAVAPNTPAILGVASPVSFLTPAQARTVMSVPSVAEMNAAIGSSGLTPDPVVRHAGFTALANTTHYVWSLDGTNKTITLPASPVDGDRIEIIGLGNGNDQFEINNTAARVYFNGDISSDPGVPFYVPGGGLHLLLVFRSSVATGGSDAWYNTTDGVSTQFADEVEVMPHAIITSDGASGVPGKVGAMQLGPNSLVGRSASNQIDALPIDDGELLFRPIGGQVQSASPSELNPWSATISGSGTYVLEVNKINKYFSGPSITLQFPIANHGDELEIKECSSSAGTAPDVVVMDTNSGFIFVENIGVGGNTQTDNLTEYKTWIKYKYDSSQSVWRIVGAAYQLP